MPDNSAAFFFDAVVLSNFALIDQFHLLVNRYGAGAFVTGEVLDEITIGISAGYVKLQNILSAIEREAMRHTYLSIQERGSYAQFLGHLNSGEASCIACAVSRGGMVATDDRAARTACTDHKLEVTGTVGILKALCTDTTVTPDEADGALQAMVDQGFYSPVRRITDIL